MINVALMGSLASRVRDFSKLHLNTPVKWARLGDVEAGTADLALYLLGDPSGEEELSTSHQQGSPIVAVAVGWKEIPAASNFERILQLGLRRTYGFVVGYYEKVHKACRWIRAAAHQASAALDLHTLIVGETGTGKELVARAIHNLGPRRGEPFVAVNCTGVIPTLFEAEFFGHTRGAFTSASSDRKGLLASAGTGTMYLDEIGDLPLELQGKLLRVIENRTFRSVGSDNEQRMRAQVVAATNRFIDEDVKSGHFRSDLYFRIAQITIYLPPLRERLNDIPLLIDYFSEKQGWSAPSLDEHLRDSLTRYDWPGNIRELQVVLQRLSLLAGPDRATALDSLRVTPAAREHEPDPRTLSGRREVFDRRVLEEVLTRHQGDAAGAAKELGITRRSVYNLVKRLGVDLKRPRSR